MPAPDIDPNDDRARLEARGVRLQTNTDVARGNLLVDARVVREIPIGNVDSILVVHTLHDDARRKRHARALLVALSGGRVVSFTLRGPALEPAIEALVEVHEAVQRDKELRGVRGAEELPRRYIRIPRVLRELATRMQVSIGVVLVAAGLALDELDNAGRAELIAEARRDGAR